MFLRFAPLPAESVIALSTIKRSIDFKCDTQPSYNSFQFPCPSTKINWCVIIVNYCEIIKKTLNYLNSSTSSLERNKIDQLWQQIKKNTQRRYIFPKHITLKHTTYKSFKSIFRPTHNPNCMLHNLKSPGLWMQFQSYVE